MATSYPTDFKVGLKKMNQPHMRLMLEWLGVPMAAHPAKVAEKQTRLMEFYKDEPSRVQQVYEIVVLQKLPSASAKLADKDDTIKAAVEKLYQLTSKISQEGYITAMELVTDKIRKDLEGHAKKALTEAAKDHRPIVLQQGKSKRVLKGTLPDEFEHILRLASSRVPILMVGPTGCGKTYLSEKIAEALNLEYAAQSMSEGVSESTFTGWLLPTGTSGRFEHVSSEFLRIYEQGGVFLFDEMDAADPNLMTFLNKALANDCIDVPQRFKKPRVKKHKNFVAVAAANTFGTGADAQYVGRNALDEATLDRFRAGLVHLDYSERVEMALIDSEVLTWGTAVRKAIRKRRLRREMSTRVMKDFTRLKDDHKYTVEHFAKTFFMPWAQDERGAVEMEIGADVMYGRTSS